MSKPEYLSPIHHSHEKWQGQFISQGGWQIVQMYQSVENEAAAAQTAVVICDQYQRGKIRVEGETAGQLLAAADMAINACQQAGLGLIIRLRSDLFFVSTEAGAVEESSASLANQAAASDDLVTVTDVTHGLFELWLVGPGSVPCLSRLCGLDFHESQFPDMTAKQSSVAGTAQLILHRDLGRLPAYGLIGPRSLADYLWQTIMQAGQDLDIKPIGQAALDHLRRQ